MFIETKPGPPGKLASVSRARCLPSVLPYPWPFPHLSDSISHPVSSPLPRLHQELLILFSLLLPRHRRRPVPLPSSLDHHPQSRLLLTHLSSVAAHLLMTPLSNPLHNLRCEWKLYGKYACTNSNAKCPPSLTSPSPLRLDPVPTRLSHAWENCSLLSGPHARIHECLATRKQQQKMEHE